MFQVFLGLAKKWSFYKVNGANGRILYRVSVQQNFTIEDRTSWLPEIVRIIEFFPIGKFLIFEWLL